MHIAERHYQRKLAAQAEPNKKTIAIFAAADIPAMRRLIAGMKDYVKSTGLECSFITYHYNMNRQLLKMQVEEAIMSDVSLLFAIGTKAAQTAQKVVSTRQSNTPVVFSSICDPVGNGVALSEYQGKENVTGTSVIITDENVKLDHLIALRKNMKNAVILYNPADSNLELCKNTLYRDLVKRGINVRALEIFSGDNIKFKSHGIICEETDAVFILRDYVAIRALPVIRKICRYFSISIFAQDSYSVEQGACAAYCTDDYAVGLIGGEIIRKILIDGKKAHQIPIAYFDVPSMERLMINPFTAKEQGLEMSLSELVAIPGVEFRGQPETCLTSFSG